MNHPLFIIVAIAFSPLVILGMILRSPFGYQDRSGFHFKNDSDRRKFLNRLLK